MLSSSPTRSEPPSRSHTSSSISRGHSVSSHAAPTPGFHTPRTAASDYGPSTASDWASVEGYKSYSPTSPASIGSAPQVGWPPTSSAPYFSNGRKSSSRHSSRHSSDSRQKEELSSNYPPNGSISSNAKDAGETLPPLPITSPLQLHQDGFSFERTTTRTDASTSVHGGDDARSDMTSPPPPHDDSADSAPAHQPESPGPPRSGSTLGSIGAAMQQQQQQQQQPSHSQSYGQGSNLYVQEEDHTVPVGFDEGVLRGLCDLDCGMPLLFDRMKQGMASSREAATFLKKRAVIEEEYARAMIKLARSSTESYSLSDGKSGSFVSSWQSFLRTHELLGDNRLKFSSQLSEMSEELVVLGKEGEKTRKVNKDLGTRLERGLADQEVLVDKARARFDSSAEELERLLLLKQGESVKDGSGMASSYAASSANPSTQKRTFGKAMSKLKGPKTVAQFAKQEDEVRSRMGQSSDSYRGQVLGAQAMRQEFFNLQLPRILRALKESVDEIDLATQYHLSRYAYLFESTLVNDGLTISPMTLDDSPGLKAVIDGIDIRDDFKTYMQQYALSWQMSGQRGPKRDGPSEDGFPAAKPTMSPRPSASNVPQTFSNSTPTPTTSYPTFGVDLGDQMARDGVEVPRLLEKCFEAVELHGLESMGIYRLSGMTSRVQRLKVKLDRDMEGTDLLSEENLADINDTAAVMKLWFRELPEPLLTWELYTGFIEAAKIENDRLRHIRLHERVNDLPDPNYATLKFLMGHLDKVKSREAVNQMSGSNLAIVFGPNLLGAPPVAAGGQGTALADMQWQCKCVETILQHYAEIFVDTADG